MRTVVDLVKRLFQTGIAGLQRGSHIHIDGVHQGPFPGAQRRLLFAGGTDKVSGNQGSQVGTILFCARVIRHGIITGRIDQNGVLRIAEQILPCGRLPGCQGGIHCRAYHAGGTVGARCV